MDKRESIFVISHMNVHCIKLCLYAYTPNLTVKFCAFLTSALYNGDKLVSHFGRLLYLSWEIAQVG